MLKSPSQMVWTCIFILLLPTFLIPTLQAQDQKRMNPGFDVSGVKEFWKIVDILQKDIDPSPETWKTLFDTPGHNALRREFKDAFFIRYFQAAYMPGKAQLQKGILAKAENATGWFNSWFPKAELEALDWTLKNREKVISKMHSLEFYPYTEKAVNELLKYLPETEVNDYPNVSFVIFNDSRGYDPVVISLNLLAKEEAELSDETIRKLKAQGHTKEWPHVLYFAHEFFHFYRAKKSDFRFPGQNSDDYTIVWILDQIENEGIADQINVKQLYYEDGCLTDSEAAQKTYEQQKIAPEELRELDDILAGIHDHPNWKYGLGQQARKTITRSGHAAGFYMSNVILKHFPTNELARIARNPFQFFRLYNRAAKLERNVPVFSDKAIALIAGLEKQYAVAAQ